MYQKQIIDQNDQNTTHNVISPQKNEQNSKYIIKNASTTINVASTT